ncbi:hypothetical protein CAPTEDRAFT_167325 [Capitella teleta]|uniref:Methyltransferase domain-containing protein n=1 Tax=Capitella teleta TaxID=283909 RepID=R7VFF1_CAPTE|nr:hypothetical protein CAPTEDRAFT_167325 [Capitella teleta]|eukprot:ELU17292.1 hypothetical protein CAPTEDRAFT_167325 [Capitella teleta]
MSVTRDGLFHIKSPLARTVYNKIQEDNEIKAQDHCSWYSVQLDSIQDEDLRGKFIQFEEDVETKEFLSNCYEKSDCVGTQMYHRLMKALLSWFMTSTSINGWLGRGSMFVFSSSQFRSLMNIDEHWKGDKMLDLGAGDGEVTKKMSLHFSEVHATEMSVTMVQRLQENGFKVLGIEEWPSYSATYDLVSCLNLLDRCEQPITMLHQMKHVLHPTRGRLLLAIVLPFSPYFEYG